MSFKDELKKQLDELINLTAKQEFYYSEKFHNFKIEIDDVLIKNKVIEYKQQNKTIYIYAKTNRKVNHYTHAEMFVILLHELACFMKDHSTYKACTSHGPEFWMIYNSLLLTAIKSGYISSNKISEIGDVLEGASKVRKLAKMVPQSKTASSRVRLIVFKVSQAEKDGLKENGYFYNPLARIWYKEISQAQAKAIPEKKNMYKYNANKFHLLASSI